ncbi:hypothetical protein [Kitasatospora sp. NPDC097691]|uniref:hypothetical protein n=1 Tax=Kitasatospora sp. NPDC097691 TaxID=3157231 RepID=UPI003317CD7C
MHVGLWTSLGWIYLLVPFVCWAALVRTRAVGAAVFAVLTGMAAILVGLQCEWFFVRPAAELQAGYPFMAGLVILVGEVIEKRLRGPRPEDRFVDRVGAVSVTVCVHSVVGAVVVLGYLVIAHDAFLPSAAEVPLPTGVSIEHDDGGYCGSNFCSRTLTLGSTTGLSADQVETRLRAALAADGWTPGRNGALVHPHGWLVDRRLSEAFVSGRTVELSGSEITNAGS